MPVIYYCYSIGTHNAGYALSYHNYSRTAEILLQRPLKLCVGGQVKRGMGMPVEKPKNVKATLKRIISYIGRNKNLLVGMLTVTIAAT